MWSRCWILVGLAGCLLGDDDYGGPRKLTIASLPANTRVDSITFRDEPVIHCGPAANCTGPALSECEVALYNGASVELVATNPVCAGPAFVALEWSAPCAPSIADSCRFTLGSKDVTVTVLGLSGAR